MLQASFSVEPQWLCLKLPFAVAEVAQRGGQSIDFRGSVVDPDTGADHAWCKRLNRDRTLRSLLEFAERQ